MNRGILVVVSGFSGVGKGTLMKELLRRYDSYALSISATSRQPREGEEDGREYFFKTREEFEDLIARGRLLEYASFCGNYYGTPLDYVEEQLGAGKDVILEIEQQGALKVKELLPDALLLFVMPPDARTLRERLCGRGTEAKESIEARLSQAVEEARQVPSYDYIIVNDTIDRAVEELHELIQSQRNRVANNLDFIHRISNELQAFVQ